MPSRVRPLDAAGRPGRGRSLSMLNQDIALVTGATRGIGKAIAQALGKAGATVIGTATTPAGVEQISAYLKADGIKGKGLVLDVADAAQVEATMKAIAAEFG